MVKRGNLKKSLSSNLNMEEKAEDVFLFTSESVGEGHPGIFLCVQIFLTRFFAEGFLFGIFVQIAIFR